MSTQEMVLFAFHSENKLKNLEWQRVGCRMHIFGNTFIRSSQGLSGVEIIRFFINKNGNICPGQPKILLNVDQWDQLLDALKQVHTYIFQDKKITPCFYNADHFDNEGEFVGCPNCLCFTGESDKKPEETKSKPDHEAEDENPPAKLSKIN